MENIFHGKDSGCSISAILAATLVSVPFFEYHRVIVERQEIDLFDLAMVGAFLTAAGVTIRAIEIGKRNWKQSKSGEPSEQPELTIFEEMRGDDLASGRK